MAERREIHCWHDLAGPGYWTFEDEHGHELFRRGHGRPRHRWRHLTPQYRRRSALDRGGHVRDHACEEAGATSCQRGLSLRHAAGRGKKVRLEFDIQRREKYKRLLAYVYVDDIMLNAELMRQGYAQVATSPPHIKYQELFLQPQCEAREAKRELWEVQ